MTSGIDADYHRRAEFLATLMKQNPNTKMRKLQKEALRMYPVQSKELQRHLLSIRYAFYAADILNKELEDVQ